ncbi:MAG TPA: sulfotransferase [Planctomycetota bacterium]|nr:sulfotransferase [Planctomycetota bacterium]
MSGPTRVVYLAGVARSGTSWIGQILAAHPRVRFRFQPLFAYEFQGRVDEGSPAEAYERLFDELFESRADFLLQRDKRASGEYPELRETGAEDVLAFKENRYQSVIAPMLRRVPRLSVVGIVRNPCAVLNSWRQNAKEFPPGADFEREWRHGLCKNRGPQDYFGYYRWKEVAHLYLDLAAQHPERFHLLHYEQAVREPAAEAAKLLAFCGLGPDPAVDAFVRASTSTHHASYYAVFKGAEVADRWRAEMPPHVVAEIEADLCGTRLERFLA